MMDISMIEGMVAQCVSKAKLLAVKIWWDTILCKVCKVSRECKGMGAEHAQREKV